jgi:hypothetical protein
VRRTASPTASLRTCESERSAFSWQRLSKRTQDSRPAVTTGAALRSLRSCRLGRRSHCSLRNVGARTRTASPTARRPLK